jgi:glutaredoxin
VKEFLSRAGRAYTVKDVDEDEDAYRELVSLGVMTIPVTVIGDSVISGYDEAKLKAALDATPPPGR